MRIPHLWLLGLFSLCPRPIEALGENAAETICISVLETLAEARKPPPSVQRAAALAKEIRTMAGEMQNRALQAGNLESWLRAENLNIQARNSQNFEWIFQELGDDPYGLADWQSEFDAGPQEVKRLETLQAIERLKAAAEQTPEKSDKIRYSMERIPDSPRSRILIVLPRAVDLKALERFPIFKLLGPDSHYLYLEPVTGCAGGACEDIYGNKSQAKHEGVIDLTTLQNLKPPDAGMNHFLEPESGIRRDPIVYLLQIAVGFYSNEKYIYRIPDQLIEKKK